jgi:hypothetical protein
MEPDQATRHLQVIRTLMERAALYRRTLTPILLYVGTLGILSAITGILLRVESLPAFAALWSATAALALAGAFLIARLQALRDREAFWSGPTHRVAQALALPLFAGLCFSVVILLNAPADLRSLFIFPNVFFYACALHAAGAFMPRGVQGFAWILLSLGAGSLVLFPALINLRDPRMDHALMGLFFGASHLGCALRLHITRRQSG